MRRIVHVSLALAAALTFVAAAIGDEGQAKTPEWALNATVIEACSCPMFCQCYFQTRPAAHGPGCAGCTKEGERYCRFNNAYKVNGGHYGAVKLDGVKFWLSGDLGGDFAKGEMDWCVATFDKSTTKEQRDGTCAILGHLFPVKWASFTTAEGEIEWAFDKDGAHAKLDGGKTAEVKLKRFQGMTDEPIVIKNLRYWGAPRNDGFILFPSEVEAYRVGPKKFEIHDSNGFMLTVDITSKDVAEKPKGGGGY